MITKYPGFVVTFQPSTDVREVLLIKKICHCIIWWEKYKSTKPVCQCLTANLLAIHWASVVSPTNASSVINHMQCGNAKNPLARLQNASTAAQPTQPILLTVLHIHHNSTSYINCNCASRSQLHLFFSSCKLTFQLSSHQHLHPDRTKHGLTMHLNLQPQRILSLSAECLKP